MPYTTEHKQRSRLKILNSAIKCFTRKGFENTSIDEVMADAELTRGAFYAHFSSKSDLYQQSILSGAMNSQLAQEKPDNIDDRDWIEHLVKGYLSAEHVQQKSGACPLAFLVTDVAVSNPDVRRTYTRVFQRMNKLITQTVRQFADCSEEDVFAVTALMIGGVAIGRSLDNKTTLNRLLDSCQTTALKLLEGGCDKK